MVQTPAGQTASGAIEGAGRTGAPPGKRGGGALPAPVAGPATHEAAVLAGLHPPAAQRSAVAPNASVPARRTALRWLIALLFLAAYVLADSVTELFPHPRFGVQPWNLRPALAIAFVASGSSGSVFGTLLAVLSAWAIVPGAPLGVAGIFAGVGLTASCWAAGTALRRWTQWGADAVRPRDVNYLLAVALATATLASAIDALRQVNASGLDASAYPLLTWRLFIADLLGIVVWMPPVWLLLAGAWKRWGARWPRSILVRDALLFALVLGALLVLVFGFQPLDDFRMSYLLFLPMIVVAMRYGLAGVVTTLPMIQLGLLGALATVGIRPGTAFEFQLLILTLAISSLYLGALTDERRRATELIAQNERALRERSHALDEALRIASTAELAAALAHDLSQPLSAIGTYARASQLLAERGAAEHSKLVDTLRLIVGETARAGQYLRRMREFFRTGAMHTDRVPVASLFESTHAHLRDRLQLGHVSWHTTIEPGLPALRADAVQTGAVLGNLVANACDAMAASAAPRQIHLRAQRVPGSDPPMVRIDVQDAGPGVPPELRDRLFKPLATSKPNGMGLGLALSRSIAERQGGRLWYEADGAGTTFCLELPGHG